MALGKRLIVLAAGSVALQGCLAKTAIDVATLPVKVASHGVDLATTSQAEADQKRGRELRRREERLGKLQRDYDRLSKKCAGGDRDACERQHLVYSEIQMILPTVPTETAR